MLNVNLSKKAVILSLLVFSSGCAQVMQELQNQIAQGMRLGTQNAGTRYDSTQYGGTQYGSNQRIPEYRPRVAKKQTGNVIYMPSSTSISTPYKPSAKKPVSKPVTDELLGVDEKAEKIPEYNAPFVPVSDIQPVPASNNPSSGKKVSDDELLE